LISKDIQDDVIELAKSAGYRIMEIYKKISVDESIKQIKKYLGVLH